MHNYYYIRYILVILPTESKYFSWTINLSLFSCCSFETVGGDFSSNFICKPKRPNISVEMYFFIVFSTLVDFETVFSCSS